MKKYLLVLISLILTLSLFISCDNGSKAPSSTTEEKPTTTSEIVILDFTEVSNSRGITGFPADSPFYQINGANKNLEDELGDVPYNKYGFWMNCNVMRSLPILPGLKSANANAGDYVESIKNKEFTAYGFSSRVEKAEATSDGVYIVYDILEGQNVNGRIEYYYSTVEKKFSYREIVAPLFGAFGGDQIFVFEMYNVPVEKDENGYSFKAGNLYENGSTFRHISFIDSTGIDSRNSTNKIEKMLIEDAKLLMNYNKSSVTSMEYEKYTSIDLIPLNIIKGEETLQPIDVSNRANALQLDDQISFLTKVFKDKSFAFSGYSTLEEFNNSNIEYIDGRLEKIKEKATSGVNYKGIGFPLSYDLDNNIGACLYNSNGTVLETHFDSSAGSAYSFTPFVLEQFKKCFDSEDIRNFDQFVSLMFKNLGLSEYADSPELRKSLLRDSYNNT